MYKPLICINVYSIWKAVNIVSTVLAQGVKKRKKAQKLVQKAKARQQSKRAVATEEKAATSPPPRRSSRCQDIAKKNYCEPEVACLFKSWKMHVTWFKMMT